MGHFQIGKCKQGVLALWVMLWATALWGIEEQDVELIKGTDANGNDVWKAGWDSKPNYSYLMKLSNDLHS